MKNHTAFRIAALITAAALLVSLCSCVPEDAPDEDTLPSESQAGGEDVEVVDYPLTLDDLISTLNSEREASPAAEYDMESFLPDYTAEDFLADEFTDEEFRILTAEPGEQPYSITCEQAVEDVEYLFRILRTSYGAYTFFGGDEVFGAAKNELIERLETFYSHGILRDELRRLMLEELSFIQDSHFSLDGVSVDFEEQRCFHDRHRLVFRRDSHGYYACPNNDASGERWYLSEEDEQYIKITIAEDGELVYGLFAVTTVSLSRQLPKYIVLTNTAGQYTKYEAQWQIMANSIDDLDDECYSSYDEKGVPVIALNSYYLDEETFDYINSYLNSAKTLRDSDAVIVDLSFNTGGYDSLSSMWLYSLTSGTDVDWGVGYASYISRLNEYVLTYNEDEVDSLFNSLDFASDYPEYMESSEDEEELSVGDTYIIEPSGEYVEQDRTIFVIFNKYTYSAGELALFQFENMSNIVFVGQNSNGCLLTGGVNVDAPVYLPNSGIPVNYSILLVTSNIMDGFDAYGFQPDIFVPNADAAELAAKCWSYYN